MSAQPDPVDGDRSSAGGGRHGLIRTRRRGDQGRLRRVAGLSALLLLIAAILAYRHYTDPQRVRKLVQA
ncbi:MAG: hypothetical protein GY778_09835, partial [bacterium]|nr:hypothetical protein [bacterium]